MKLLLSLCFSVAFFSLSSIAHSATYPLVLVHGLQPSKLGTQLTPDQVDQNGALYWSEYWGARAQARIDWPSTERIAGRIATDYVWPKLRQLSIDGTCNPGCIFITHSTGDLVTRYILDNQALWLTNAGLRPLNIIATYDFSGAGGGSELADLAVNAAGGSSLLDSATRYALSLWLGRTVSANMVGVLNDLRVNSARQLAPFPSSRVPRLRFTGNASDYLGLTSPFLPGEDDGVVAAHSSCGASTAVNVDSCSRSVAFDGKIASQSRGVVSFMPQHYPIMMSSKYSHAATVGAQPKGQITTANNSATFLNSGRVAVSTYDEKRGFWVFSSHYRVVTDSNRYSMSELALRSTF